MKAITDRSRIKKDDLGHPDECEVVYKYWKIFGDENQIADINDRCSKGVMGCAECKRALAERVNSELREIRERRKYYENHIDEVRAIIKDGSLRAQKEAQIILSEVRNLVRMYKR